MATSGPNSATTITDDASVGTVAWITPSNAASSNDVRATFTPAGAGIQSHYLKFVGFNFAISGTIDGVEVRIERLWNGLGGNPRDVVVSLLIAGALAGANKADTGVDWPSVEAYKTYGGATDLWTLTPSASDINGANFGLVLSASGDGATNVMSVDHADIKIYYTVGASSFVSFKRATRFFRSR